MLADIPLSSMCRVFGFGNPFSPAPTNGAIFKSSGLITEFAVTPVSNPSSRIGEFTVAGTNVILDSTNGAAGVDSTLLITTNLTSPNWIHVIRNVFDANGSFLIANSMTTHSRQEFYLLDLPTH
jgi:hypothetical protein